MKDALPENIRWNSNWTSLSWHSNKVRSTLVWSHIVRDSRTCLKLFTFQSCSVSIYPCKRITKTLKSKSQYYIWGVDLLIVLIWNQSDCELPSGRIHISEPQFCSHKRPDLHSTPILATFLLIHNTHAYPHLHPHARLHAQLVIYIHIHILLYSSRRGCFVYTCQALLERIKDWRLAAKTHKLTEFSLS